MPYGTMATSAARLMPHSVTLYRPGPGGAEGTELAAQTCRIDTSASSAASEIRGPGVSAVLSATVYGAPDMDIRRDDLFRWPVAGGTHYRIVSIEEPMLSLSDAANSYRVAKAEVRQN